MIYHAFENYNEYNLDVVRTLLADEDTICGLGDGGAHVDIFVTQVVLLVCSNI